MASNGSQEKAEREASSLSLSRFFLLLLLLDQLSAQSAKNVKLLIPRSKRTEQVCAEESPAKMN